MGCPRRPARTCGTSDEGVVHPCWRKVASPPGDDRRREPGHGASRRRRGDGGARAARDVRAAVRNAAPIAPSPVQPVPASEVASVNTHDMPPFAAFWKGLDIDDRLDLGLIEAREVPEQQESRERSPHGIETAPSSGSARSAGGRKMPSRCSRDAWSISPRAPPRLCWRRSRIFGWRHSRRTRPGLSWSGPTGGGRRGTVSSNSASCRQSAASWARSIRRGENRRQLGQARRRMNGLRLVSRAAMKCTDHGTWID